MAVCYKCNCSLDDTNWMASFKKRNQRICKSCYRSNFNSKNGPQRLYINGVYIPKDDPRHKVFKPGNYKNINDAVFSQSSINQIQEGYVYVITNKAWPDWVKIGMAIDAKDRCNGYQTSSPHRDYVLEHSVASNDRRKSEQEAHTKAAKLAEEVNGEWFKLTVQQAIEVLNNLDEHRLGTAEEANTDTPKDKLQERSIQEDLWTYTQNRKTA